MRIVVIILLLVFPVQALAGPFAYSFKVLPRGEKCENSDHWCYTLEEFKLIIQYDHELFTLRDESKLLKEQLETKKKEIDNLNEQIDTYLHDKEIMASEIDRLRDKWARTDIALQECESKKPLWPWIVGGIGGAALLAGVILILVDQNQEGNL